MKRMLFLAVLLVAAGCASEAPAQDFCRGADAEGFAPVGCMDYLLVENASAMVVMLDRVVESASFSSGRATGPCELIVRGRSSEVVCDVSPAAQGRVVGNISGSAFFDNASRPYLVRVSVSGS